MSENEARFENLDKAQYKKAIRKALTEAWDAIPKVDKLMEELNHLQDMHRFYQDKYQQLLDRGVEDRDSKQRAEELAEEIHTMMSYTVDPATGNVNKRKRADSLFVAKKATDAQVLEEASFDPKYQLVDTVNGIKVYSNGEYFTVDCPTSTKEAALLVHKQSNQVKRNKHSKTTPYKVFKKEQLDASEEEGVPRPNAAAIKLKWQALLASAEAEDIEERNRIYAVANDINWRAAGGAEEDAEEDAEQEGAAAAEDNQ
jgi:hypothetical protein